MSRETEAPTRKLDLRAYGTDSLDQSLFPAFGQLDCAMARMFDKLLKEVNDRSVFLLIDDAIFEDS